GARPALVIGIGFAAHVSLSLIGVTEPGTTPGAHPAATANAFGKFCSRAGRKILFEKRNGAVFHAQRKLLLTKRFNCVVACCEGEGVVVIGGYKYVIVFGCERKGCACLSAGNGKGNDARL